MHLGGGSCNERQRGTDPNLTQNAPAPKHITALPRPSGGPANYSGQLKNSGTQKICPITEQQHPHLCRACLRQTCDEGDPYAGSGTLTCLLDHAADAAIVSDVDLRKLRVTNPDVERLFHYCRSNDGGSIQPLGDSTGLREEPCDWGKRPVPVFMSASSCNTTKCLRSIDVLAVQSHAVMETLRLPLKTQITQLNQPHTPSDIIEKAGYTIDDTSRQKVVKFCTRNEDEMAKCEDLAMVTQAFDAGKTSVNTSSSDDSITLI
ncbi:hypothetical protein E2C01_036353 [Portunus trituberculatus]|uniref:Transferrin-like domain-containing protein n=1 Tax=Portunus trituberculatus TaxID=210409 RepID=A0A5B7FB51_PORTR|nr:hypothetical protein [Portunus trituberculatus]